MMTSVLQPLRSFGRLWTAARFPGAMQAAVPRVSADAAPQVTSAASHFKSLAMYSPEAFCRSARRTGDWAARATAACADGGMIEAVNAVYVPAALMILVTPSFS